MHIRLPSDNARLLEHEERWRLFTGGVCVAHELYDGTRYGACPPVEELIKKVRVNLVGAEIVGIWVDERLHSPSCPLRLAARRIKWLSFCILWAGGDQCHPERKAAQHVALQQRAVLQISSIDYRTPRERKAGLEDAGTQQKSATVLGSRTVEYLDKTGDRHDFAHLC